MTDWRPRDPAARAYLRRFIPTMVAYVALVWIVPFTIRVWHPAGPALWAVALLPALPVIAVFWLIGRYIVELRDEYVRMLEVRKALVATGITMTVATAWGFLEMMADAPHLPLFWIPIIWFAGLGAGGCVNALLRPENGE